MYFTEGFFQVGWAGPGPGTSGWKFENRAGGQEDACGDKKIPEQVAKEMGGGGASYQRTRVMSVGKNCG